MVTIVRYFVLETDEYQEPKNPNVVRVDRKRNEIQLKHIKEKFAEWKGGFKFYFKTLLEGETDDANFVWEDIQDDEQIVPTFKGNITVKAVRTGYKQFFEIKSRTIETPVNAGTHVYCKPN